MLISKRHLFRFVALILCFALLFSSFSFSSFAEGETQAAVVNGNYVRVRTGPGTNYGIVMNLNTGHSITITGSACPSESAGTPNPWYPITFQSGGTQYSGYMYSDYVTIIPNVAPGAPNTSFEAQLAAFPESYRGYLVALHEAHPSWNFEAVNTKLDWNYVQEKENVTHRSLINFGPASYRSTAPGCYDWNTDTYYVLEGKDWYQASPTVVAYYMDPRNFLNEDDVFQFERLSYDPALQTEAGVDAMLQGSFMAGTVIQDLNGNPVTYTTAFAQAAATHNVSLYHLVARCIQEIGRDGKAAGTCGTYPGYEGIYNYYSIGANGGAVDGLRYAAQSDASTYRPWNTPYKSIMGGAQFLSDGYISAGQDTLYFQKFSVVGSQLFWHQYMASIASANNEGHTIRKNYARLGLLETGFTFRIPVYENMPASPCAMPAETGSPNCYLSSLSVAGYGLTPTFDTFNQTEYDLILPVGVNTITVTASAISAAAGVYGNVGTLTLPAGNHTLTVSCSSAAGNVRDYHLHVVVQGEFQPPTPSDPTIPSGWNPPLRFEGSMVGGVAPGLDVGTFLQSLGTYGNAAAALCEASGAVVSGGPVHTGLVLRYFDGTNTTDFTVVVFGDVNCDGGVDAIDLLAVRKVILGLYPVNDAQKKAADVTHDGEVDAVDLLLIRKTLLGLTNISQ